MIINSDKNNKKMAKSNHVLAKNREMFKPDYLYGTSFPPRML